MLSMFKEKEQGEAQHWSMTRVVAFVSAITLNYIMLRLSVNNHVHDIAWPFCTMYIIVLLAVPIQTMLKLFQYWMNTAPGHKLLTMLLDKVNLGGVSTAPSATVNVGVGTPDPDKDK